MVSEPEAAAMPVKMRRKLAAKEAPSGLPDRDFDHDSDSDDESAIW